LKGTLVFMIVMFVVGLVIGATLGPSLTGAPAGTVIQTITVAQTVTSAATQSIGGSLVRYCFSPGGNCASVLVSLINNADISVHVLIYSFTLDNVADALIQAKGRGVDVKVVMEKDNALGSGSEYTRLKSAGIDIRLDTNSALMHDKVAIIDAHVIVTGSFNWSSAANDGNNENMIVIDSQAWAVTYEATFQTIYNTAMP